MKDAIRVENLIKRYGDRTVLKGLSFRVAKGEIFALLGANGAGKTTALECIEGLRRYDSGHISLDGKIGIQMQAAALPAHIRPMEAIRLVACANRTVIDASLLSALGLSELADRQYAALSTGQQRRLHLALALIRQPDILFLDEPTAGLDLEGRQSLHAYIRGLREQGTTIVLASHDMAEVAALSDRIAILRSGELVFSGTSAELSAQAGECYTISIRTDKEDRQLLSDDITGTLLTLLDGCRRRGETVLDLRVEHGTLEQQVLDIMGGKNI